MVSQKTASGLVSTIVKYDAPLQRYARRLVKDPAIAAALVKEVFERVYNPLLAQVFPSQMYKLIT